ncbi:MAG: nucleotidyltransferase family protein [Chlorobiaceae bacterium]|nr:nucleotidyltransferase family protein [Chlorobiaceae bacterium]
MNKPLAKILCRRVWPKGDLDLLVKTSFLPETEAAKCWIEWKKVRDIDKVSWEEHKLLARIAARIAALDPHCPYRARIEGLSKAHWTHSQLMLRQTASAIDLLAAQGIPVMLLKGGALHAAALSNQGARITGDLDVLVHRSDFQRSVETLYACGWSSKSSLEFARVQWRFRSGINLHIRPHGDIDIHHQPLHESLLSDDLIDALWARAEQSSFHGRSVLIPALADQVVIAAEHAIKSQTGNEPAAAWVFDMISLIRQPSIDPAKLLDSASALHALPATMATISYLFNLTGDIRIREFVTAIESGRTAWGDWSDFYIKTAKKPYGKRLRALSRIVSRQNGYEFERDAILKIHPHPVARHAGHEVLIDKSRTKFRPRHEIMLPDKATMKKRLVLEIEIKQGSARRYYCEISADGHPIATLSSRLPGRGTIESKNFAFALPAIKCVPGSNLAIEVFGKFPVPGHTGGEAYTIESADFRILRMSWDQ